MLKNNFRGIVSGIVLGCSVLLFSCQSSHQLLQPGLMHQKHAPEFLSSIPISESSTGISLAGADSKVNKPLLSNPAEMLRIKYASLLGIVPEAIANFSLYRFIDEWYGVRYRLGGDDKQGIDCSAFAQKLYENVFCTNLVRTAMEQFKSCRLVKSIDSLKEGDLVFFQTRGKRVSHVGIYLTNHFFVHASSSKGVMISSLEETYWSRLYAGAGIIPEINFSL